MKSEKEKMLAGEMYKPWDDELVAERRACRRILHVFNSSLIESKDWKHAIESLLPNADAYIEPPFFCDYGTNIKTGKSFFANFNCTILDVAEVTIGDNVMFAPNVQVYTATHPLEKVRRTDNAEEFGLPITIGNNVWVGGGAIICPGVTIGDNSVIGAGAVVTKDIPANVVAAGNPCRVIKPINND